MKRVRSNARPGGGGEGEDEDGGDGDRTCLREVEILEPRARDAWRRVSLALALLDGVVNMNYHFSPNKISNTKANNQSYQAEISK